MADLLKRDGKTSKSKNSAFSAKTSIFLGVFAIFFIFYVFIRCYCANHKKYIVDASFF